MAFSALSVALLSCSPESAPEAETQVDESAPTAETHVGGSAELGDGTIWTYAEVDADGSLASVGARLDAALLEDPPSEPDGTAPCFDADGDGTMDPHTECFIMLRRDIPLPPSPTATTVRGQLGGQHEGGRDVP